MDKKSKREELFEELKEYIAKEGENKIGIDRFIDLWDYLDYDDFVKAGIQESKMEELMLEIMPPPARKKVTSICG
ncbi:MAG: hypothetical protein AAB696_01820 [Patescibacteria group bacterium]